MHSRRSSLEDKNRLDGSADKMTVDAKLGKSQDDKTDNGKYDLTE